MATVADIARTEVEHENTGDEPVFSYADFNAFISAMADSQLLVALGDEGEYLEEDGEDEGGNDSGNFSQDRVTPQ